MVRRITQRDLRNRGGEILRGLDGGESFVVIRNGVPVGELIPVGRRRFVTADVIGEAFADAPRQDHERFPRDLNSVLDQEPGPRS